MKISLFVLIMLLACEPGRPPVPEHKIIARVNDEILTIEDIQDAVSDSTQSAVYADVYRQLIKQWITRQILADQSIRRGYQLTEKQQFNIEELKRQYLIENMTLALMEKINLSESEIQTYYQTHLADYARPEAEYHLIHLFLPKRNYVVQGEIARERDLKKVIEKFQLGKVVNETLVTGDLGYRTLASIPDPLQRRLRDATPGQIIGPVNVNGSYHYMQVIDVQAAGTNLPLDRVRDVVRARLLQERLKSFQSQLIENNKSNYIIQTKY